MRKRFRCKDLGWKCGYLETSSTVTELMVKVQEHLRKFHALPVLPADVRQRAESVIYEVPPRERPGWRATAGTEASSPEPRGSP